MPIHTILEDFSAEDGPVRFADGQSITIAGIVTASRTRTTRNNALMAYVTVEDEAASIELLCFSRTIERCGSYMQVNSPVLVQGKLSVRDEKPPQIMCDSVYPLKEGLPPRRENRRPAQENATIYLRVPGMDSPAFQHIKLVMTMFEGDTPTEDPAGGQRQAVGGQVPEPPGLRAGVPGVAGPGERGGENRLHRKMRLLPPAGSRCRKA